MRPGPSSGTKAPINLATTAQMEYFAQGNAVEGRTQYQGGPASMFSPTEADGRKLSTLANKPFPVPPVTTTTAGAAYKEVLAKVGAGQPVRDPVDARLIREVINRTGHIIDSQKEVGGWPEYHSAPVPRNSDEDGIPDDWESAHGLNPKNPTDSRHISTDGYTHLDHYLNSLADSAASH